MNLLNILLKKIYLIINKKNQRNNLYSGLTFLKKKGFYPETIIDVGVAKGTKPLYLTFPKSYFLLIEPIKKYEFFLNQILKNYNGHYCLAAASKEKGEVSFNVHPKHMDGSSLLKEEIGVKADGYEIKVPTVKIDDLIKEKNSKNHFL